MEEASTSEPPAPWRQVAVLCLCITAHFYSICSLFSYGAIMCVDLGWAPDKDSAGFVAGYLQSANALARVPTASAWGILADRVGRKAALTATMGLVALGGVAFGLAADLPLALACRAAFFGLGNGWVTLLGPLSAEVAGPARQPEVLGKVFAMAQFIQLFGPAIGGWTYGAASRYPGLIPSVLTTAFGCVAMVAICQWLPSGIGLERQPNVEGVEAGRPEQHLRICLWPIPMVIGLRAMNGFIEWAMFDLMPLWAISSVELGGLALSQMALGYVLSAAGLGGMCFSLCALPRLTGRMGVRRSAMLAAGVGAAACLAFPFARGALSALLLLSTATCARQVMVTACLVFTNNVIPRSRRATMSGVAVMFEGMAKGAAPATTAYLFAWSLARWGRLGRAAAFWMVAALHLLFLLGVGRLPAYVETGVEEAVEERAPPRNAGLATVIGAETDGKRGTEQETGRFVSAWADAGNNGAKDKGAGQKVVPTVVGAEADGKHGTEQETVRLVSAQADAGNGGAECK